MEAQWDFDFLAPIISRQRDATEVVTDALVAAMPDQRAQCCGEQFLMLQARVVPSAAHEPGGQYPSFGHGLFPLAASDPLFCAITKIA
jgi:hypothetical protein